MEKIDTPHYIVELARKLRGRQTPAEQMLWACLRDRSLVGAKFRRQHPLGRYVADFYCHKARLVIELQGRVHDDHEQIQYDAVRQDVIKSQTITILTFKNEEVIQDLEGVLAKIKKALAAESNPLLPLGEG